MLVVGLVFSSGYLGWLLLVKYMVDCEVDCVLVVMGLVDVFWFLVVMLFNILFW